MEYSDLPQLIRDMTELSMSRRDRDALAATSRSNLELSNKLTGDEYFQKRRLEKLVSDVLDHEVVINDDTNRTSTWKEKAILVEEAIQDISSDKICDLFRGDLIDAKIGIQLYSTLDFEVRVFMLANTAILNAEPEAAIYTMKALIDNADNCYWTTSAIKRDNPDILAAAKDHRDIHPSEDLLMAVRTASLNTIQVALDAYISSLGDNINDDDLSWSPLLEAASRGRRDVVDLLFDNEEYVKVVYHEDEAGLHDSIFNLLRAYKGCRVPPRTMEVNIRVFVLCSYIVGGHTDLAVKVGKKAKGMFDILERILPAYVEAIHKGHYETTDAILQIYKSLKKNLFKYATTYGDVVIMNYLIDRDILPKDKPEKILKSQSSDIVGLRAITKLYCRRGRDRKTRVSEDWELLCGTD
jgi:ankyrin repeat protein